MNKITRILIGLELSSTDLSIIKYVRNVVDSIKPERIDFIHVSENLSVNAPEEYDFTSLDEKIELEMKKNVDLYFGNTKYETNFEVVEGNPEKQLLHWATIKSSDLIILGRKTDKKHAELTLEKIVRSSPCSVLVVPQNASSDTENILFPVDYSEKTIEGIELLNKVFYKPKIKGLNFFDLPKGYYKTGKSEEEFIEILKNNANKEAEKIKLKLSNYSELSFENVCSEGLDEFDYIIDYAKNNKYSIIAIGSRGRTNAASLLLGSFAEKFIRHNREIPTFIFKTKGENMDFLKAFLNF